MKNGMSKVHPASIQMLTDATWKFAHQVLWDNELFSKEEKLLAKAFIREYYEAIPPDKFHKKAPRLFARYCERVLLARKYVDRYSHRYIPHPCIWLDKRNPKGFAGTKRWADENRRKRQPKTSHAALVVLIPLPQTA